MFLFKMIILSIWNSFILTNRPMQKIMLLIFNLSLLLTLFSLLLKSSWFNLIFMILMASGLMILFMYMASIQKNFMFNNINFSFSFLNNILMIFIIVKLYKSINQIWFHSSQENLFLNFFNFFNFNTLIFLLINFMLILMIIYMELISNFNYALRSN